MRVPDQSQPTYIEAAIIILNESEEPLSSREIYRRIQSSGIIKPTESFKHKSIRRAVNNHLKNMGDNSPIEKIKKDLYKIRDSILANKHIFTAQKRAEKVLVIENQRFRDVGQFHGLQRNFDYYFESLLKDNQPIFINRLKAEEDDDYKQIVCYVMVMVGDKLLRFSRRAVNTFNSYIDGKYSIGFGGHISLIDFNLFSANRTDSGYSAGFERELFEELGISEKDILTSKNLGVLNDESTPLGSRHLAFVHLVEIDQNRYKNDNGELEHVELVSFEEISREYSLFEYWSKLCLNEYFSDKLNFYCHVQDDLKNKFQSQSKFICVIGGIGSGKSEISKFLCHNYNYYYISASSVLKKHIILPDNYSREEIQDQGYEFIISKDAHLILVNSIVEEISLSQSTHFVIDGLRFVETYNALRERLKSKINIIYVENTFDNRLRFYNQRDRQSESPDRFRKIINHPAEQGIEKFLPLANTLIFNLGDIASFKAQIKNYFLNEYSNNSSFLIQAWDMNAERRHLQLTEFKDITYSHLFLPLLEEELQKTKDLEVSTVLEIGCGTGVLMKHLSSKVRKIVGVDPSPKSINIATKHLSLVKNLDLICSPFEDYEDKSMFNAFDIVIAHKVFHTIPDTQLELILTQTQRYLKDDGLLIFLIPHPYFFARDKSVKEFFDSTNYRYETPALYRIPFTITKDNIPLPSKTPHYHRPVSNYLNVLNKTGFWIESIMDPKPSREIISMYDNARDWSVPRFLLAKCVKQ